MDLPLETTVADVKARLAGGESLQLIDVREPFEHQIASIAGSELIPMNTVPVSLQQIEKKSDDGTLIVFCHHGMRSLSVVNWLRQQGVSNCQSMSGGIDRWSTQIDPSVPRY
ncbi:MAG: rhodanese-like domain-containing protein [Bryobacteraceae bacterium]